MSSIHWIHDVDGDFNTPGDWGGGSIPGPNDAAILDAAGAAFTVTATSSDGEPSVSKICVLAAGARTPRLQGEGIHRRGEENAEQTQR